AAAWQMGAEVDLVSGPTALPTPVGVRRTEIETAAEMAAAVERLLPDADVLVMAAAVADFRPADPRGQKIKKGEEQTTRLELEPTTDVLRNTIPLRRPGAVAVGFALETESPVENG